MRVRSKFIDVDGERELDKIVPLNSEGREIIEDIWIQSFRDMLLGALECGDDVEISVKRIPNMMNTYMA